MQFNRVMLPVDFSEHSDRCLDDASRLMTGGDGQEIHFLYVLHTPTDFSTWEGDPTTEVRKRLDELVERFSGTTSAVVTAEVRTGHASTEICRYATDHKCDLIMMATHGRTGLAHMLLGSTAEQVVRHAPCPVLSLRVSPS